MFLQIKVYLSRFNMTGSEEQLNKDLEEHSAFAEMMGWE